MAEIKVFCLHCGQHIQCDEGYCGTQINCPTCNKLFLVPQALKAASVPTPPPPIPVIPEPKLKRRQRPDYLTEAIEWENDGSTSEEPQTRKTRFGHSTGMSQPASSHENVSWPTDLGGIAFGGFNVSRLSYNAF